MATSKQTIVGWILALVQQVVVPEVLRIVRKHYDQTGTLPTNESVIADLAAHTSEGILQGEEWLATHPPE